MPTEQQYHRGDFVKVRKTSFGEATAYIIGSYSDLYPYFSKNSKDHYSIFIVNSDRGYKGSYSWVYDNEISLIEERTMESIKKLERFNRGELKA